MQIQKPKRRSKKREGRSRKGEGSVYQHGKTGPFYFKIPNPNGGPAITGSCKTDDYEAALLFKNRELIRLHDAKPKPAGVATITEILDDYGKYIEADKPKSWPTVRSEMKPLREKLGAIIADALTTADTDQYRDDREADVEFSTVNREIGCLRSALLREMKRTPSRVSHIPFMRMPSEKGQVREGFIEREQYERLLKELPWSLKAIFVCAFHTGARAGELKKIRWAQLDWRRNIIELRPKTTKNSDGRWLPIWGDMAEHLRSQEEVRARECPHSPWLFFWHSGHNPSCDVGGKLQDFRDSWEKACTRAKVPGLLFHDLRRSAIRFADQDAGLSESLTMLMSGHKTNSTFRRYNIRGAKDIVKVGAALEDALKKLNIG